MTLGSAGPSVAGFPIALDATALLAAVALGALLSRLSMAWPWRPNGLRARAGGLVHLQPADARLIELQSEFGHVVSFSAVGEMAAALAHELNQPLTAIGNSVGAIGMMVGDAERMADSAERDLVLSAAEHAEAQVVRAGEIVRRLREFVARREMNRQPEDLDRLIDDATVLAMPSAKAAKLQIRRAGNAGLSPVLADRAQIHLVLVNLIKNAAEAMGDRALPRQLTISANFDDRVALVRLSDNGPGIPADVAERLFTPFFSTKSSNMGVGLAVSRRIIEAHGGKMWMTKEACGGAEFLFTLPLSTAEVRDVGA